MKHILLYIIVFQWFFVPTDVGMLMLRISGTIISTWWELSSFKSLDWLIHITVYKIGLCDHQIGYLTINNGDIPGSGWLLTYRPTLCICIFRIVIIRLGIPPTNRKRFHSSPHRNLRSQRRSLKLELGIWLSELIGCVVEMWPQLRFSISCSWFFWSFLMLTCDFSQNTCT